MNSCDELGVLELLARDLVEKIYEPLELNFVVDGTTHDRACKISLLQVPSTLIHNCIILPARA